MSTRRKRLALILVVFGGLIGSLGMLSLALPRSASAGGDPAAKGQKAEPPSTDKDERKADRAKLQAQMGRFLKAFESGDAKRVASFWTARGELISDDGRVYRGRAAIAKAYRELFATKESRHAEVQQETLRFPSQDTA